MLTVGVTFVIGCVILALMELYAFTYVFAQLLVLLAHHPAQTVFFALTSLWVNRRAVSVAKRRRACWRAKFFGTETPAGCYTEDG
jgi:hypothetical protein